jgi:RNA polymerase sigma-70 factor (ECF subfamily)
MPEQPDSITDPAEDIRLLQLVGQGDRAAFSQLYDRFSSVLFATAFSVLNNREAAEDVLQDAFLMIWEKAPLYNPERGKPLTWALTLTRNKAIDRLRSSQRRRRLYDAAERESLTDEQHDDRDSFMALLTSERSTLVREALGQLSPDQRQAIEMTFFGLLTQLEVAEQLNEPPGTIKARIRRGLMRLRDVLADRV